MHIQIVLMYLNMIIRYIYITVDMKRAERFDGFDLSPSNIRKKIFIKIQLQHVKYNIIKYYTTKRVLNLSVIIFYGIENHSENKIQQM